MSLAVLLTLCAARALTASHLLSLIAIVIIVFFVSWRTCTREWRSPPESFIGL